MTRTRTLTSKIRERRNEAAFTRALRQASPSMQQELVAAATRAR